MEEMVMPTSTWLLQLIAVGVAFIGMAAAVFGGMIVRDRYVFKLIADNANLLHERVDRARDEAKNAHTEMQERFDRRIDGVRDEGHAARMVIRKELDGRLDHLAKDMTDIKVDMARRGFYATEPKTPFA